MVRSLKKTIGALSVLALTVSLLPTVTAQTVPPTVQILDNATTTGFTKTGTWYSVNDSASYGGKYFYALKGAPTTKAVWTFTNLTPGQYKVSVTYRPKSSFSKTAEFRVHDGGIDGTDLGVTTVNQTVRASSGDIDGTPWQTLGAPGGHFAVLMNSLSVTLSANSSAWVQADAVRIERVGDLTGEEMLRDFAALGTVVNSTSGGAGGEGEGEEESEIDVIVFATADLAPYLGISDAEVSTLVRRSFDCNSIIDSTCTSHSGIPINVNGIMRASGVPVKVNVVKVLILSAQSVESSDDLVYTMQIDENVELLRTIYGADAVVLFAPVPQNALILGSTAPPTFSQQTPIDTVVASTNRNSFISHIENAHFGAHSVVRVDKNNLTAMTLTLTHEFGHILGTGHEEETGENFSIEPWSHALTIDGGVKTLDSAYTKNGYTNGCPVLGCSLIPLFSNPNKSVTVGAKTYNLGIADKEDNVRTMKKMAPLVARYSERPFLTLTNPENCLDSSADSIVTPIDGLRVINYLNGETSQQEIALMTGLRKVAFIFGYIDTNKDGWITPIDTLRVINHLNEPTNPTFAPATVCPR